MSFKLRLLLLTSFWFALSALVIGSLLLYNKPIQSNAPAKSRINILSDSRKHGVSISVQNDVDPDAPSGDLGLGTKIIQSILALHQSKLSTLKSSSHYNQSFELPNTHHAH